MRRLCSGLVTIAILLGSELLGDAMRFGVSPAIHPLGDGCGRWVVVGSPNGTQNSRLLSVAGIANGDVWAVGHYFVPNSDVSRTLIERWNGSQWQLASSPNPAGQYDQLYDIASVPNGFWTVGLFARNGKGFTLTLSHC